MSTSTQAASSTLAGKIAIVTGSSRGIGAAIALRLAEEGAKVTLTYFTPSSEAKADALIAQIRALSNGSDAVKVKAEFSDASTHLSLAKEIVDVTLRTFNTDTIDILVNNAGGGEFNPVVNVKPEEFDWIYNLNVRAPFFLTQAVYPHLPKSGGGRVINVGSIHSRFGGPGASVYGSTKAALEAITRSSAAEFGPAGHTVNCINPGFVETDAFERVTKDSKDVVNGMVGQTPLRRVGQGKDIADIALYLSSEGSRWITGQTIAAGGGLAMY